jgi:AcrR family transcriptional regulator
MPANHKALQGHHVSCDGFSRIGATILYKPSSTFILDWKARSGRGRGGLWARRALLVLLKPRRERIRAVQRKRAAMPPREQSTITPASNGSRPSRPSVSPRRRGSLSEDQVPRARMIKAMLDVVSEEGYSGASVTAIVSRARISSRTFYTHFESAEDCFLAAFDDCLGEIRAVVGPAYQRQGRWSSGRIRAALEALLAFLEEDRASAVLVFLEAPKAGVDVQERRARIVEILQVVVDAGRSESKAGTTPPDLTNEIVVEGAIATIQARLSRPESISLRELVNPLMSVIAYSYLGSSAAAGGGGGGGGPPTERR